MGGAEDTDGRPRRAARSGPQPTAAAPRGRPRTSRASPGGGQKDRRRPPTVLWVSVAAVVGVVVVAVAVGAVLLGRSGPAHALATPAKLGAYVLRPQLAQQMHAQDLQQEVVARSRGEVSHVIDAVYEENSQASAGTTPQVILFIGGHLSGVSPASYVTSFTDQFKGAQSISAGSLGGSAACISAQENAAGGVAVCTWADNDTFGVVASPTMDAAQLGVQMRIIRPGVEHVVN
jgi:hypothetical protein